MTFDTSDLKADRLELQLKAPLCEILVRHGAERGAELDPQVTRALDQLRDALAHTDSSGESLSALDVLRIRLGKLAAFVLPPAVFRDVRQLAQLRGELHALARTFVSDQAARGSRFSSLP
jgi:hypothetical protein